MKKIDENENVTTSATLEKRRRMTSANYTMAMTALVLAFVIVLNMVIASLSTDIRQIDLTRGNVFTITEDTKDFLKKLDKDVTIYMILEDITHRNSDLNRLLEVYEDECSHIKVETINPAQNPTFLENREYVSEGSIIVEYGDKYKALELSDMIITQEDSSSGNTYHFYDMEGQITSAISYVISDNIPKAYMLRSGTFDKLDASLLSDISKQNIDVESLELDEKGEIPEDADILILDQPAEDISDKSCELIMSFMDNGGSVIMFQYYNLNDETSMPNLEKIMAHYGISVKYGVAIESDGNYLLDNSTYYSKPVVEKHEITEDIIADDTDLMIVMGDAIEIGDVPEGVTVEPLLTSTSRAYYKAGNYKRGNGSTSMAQLASDPVGTYNYAVAATDDISDGLQSRFVYISSYSFAETDLYKEKIGTGNATFVVRCMKWLANQDTTISIPVKNRTYANLVYSFNAQNRIFYTVVVVIPAAVLIYGGFVWFRRRRR